MILSTKGNILISCCGGLHVPKMPSFPGMDKFKGMMTLGNNCSDDVGNGKATS